MRYLKSSFCSEEDTFNFDFFNEKPFKLILEFMFIKKDNGGLDKIQKKLKIIMISRKKPTTVKSGNKFFCFALMV